MSYAKLINEQETSYRKHFNVEIGMIEYDDNDIYTILEILEKAEKEIREKLGYHAYWIKELIDIIKGEK